MAGTGIKLTLAGMGHPRQIQESENERNEDSLFFIFGGLFEKFLIVEDEGILNVY